MAKLNYQELVSDYYDNLNNNLRNFKGGPGFLETWVHDEDHNRSLLEILDLAHAHGIADLTIRLPNDVTSTLDMTWLKEKSAEYGALSLKGDELKFSMGQAGKSSDDLMIAEPYRDNVGRHQVRWEGQADSRLGKVFTAQAEGTLSVAVDSAGFVQSARHSGFAGVLQVVMDAFCDVLVARPVQEGSEHGVIRLEALLRTGDRPGRVKGLFTPEMGDPIFAIPSKLIREIFNEYRKTAGGELQRNFWRDPVPKPWKAMSSIAKLERAQGLVTKGCIRLGLQMSVQVIDIKNDTRLVLSYTQDPTKPNFGHHMIKLERWLRSELGFEVELQLESIEDRNKRVQRSGR